MLRTKIVIGCYDGSVHGVVASTPCVALERLAAAVALKRRRKTSRKSSTSSSEPTTESEQEQDASFSYKLVFAFAAHETSIKCCAVSPSGKFGATGSSDESVQMYDLRRLRVVDKLGGIHESSICSLAFTPKEGYLLSGDEQGRLIVWEGTRAVHELKGHNRAGPATSIAIHPSSRIALTTSTDNSLRMWDLVNARAAPRKRIQDFKSLACACWSPELESERYALVADERLVLVFDLSSFGGGDRNGEDNDDDDDDDETERKKKKRNDDDGEKGEEEEEEEEALIGKFLHPRRVNSLCFVEDVVLVSGCDDGIVRIFGADGTLIRTFAPPPPSTGTTAAARVREVRCATTVREGVAVHLVIAAYNIGLVRIWDLDDEREEPVGEFRLGTSAHVTCMAVVVEEEEEIRVGGGREEKRRRQKKTLEE